MKVCYQLAGQSGEPLDGCPADKVTVADYIVVAELKYSKNPILVCFNLFIRKLFGMTRAVCSKEYRLPNLPSTQTR